jgi:hypothetical protein
VLNPHAGQCKCGLRRLLLKCVENDGGADRDDDGGDAGGKKSAHDLSKTYGLVHQTIAGSRDCPGAASDPVDLSSGDFERLGFNPNEGAADRADAGVEMRPLGLLQIGKKASDPGREVLFENRALGSGGRRDASAGEARMSSISVAA